MKLVHHDRDKALEEMRRCESPRTPRIVLYAHLDDAQYAGSSAPPFRRQLLARRGLPCS
jgi:hypothetical protein